MNNLEGNRAGNILEQIGQVCREFRKQISTGKSPRLETFLTGISKEGAETLFANLLEIELRYRQSKDQRPTSDEYLKRFPQFANQVRRAFFEPTMDSDDFSRSSPADPQLPSLVLEPDSASATLDTLNAQIMGDYQLVRELGRGGMGVVYEAKHTKSGNRVALKTLPTGRDGQELNADRLHRFRKEFRSLSEINHPNLVGMQTLEVDGAQWFFTMDLIEGEDFLSYVRPQGVLDVERLRSAAGQLVRGLILLHKRRIVHRDLKPSNVLVDRDGTVKILDFGLVARLQKVTDVTATKSEMFAGTPKYAAPEQLFGQRNEASDWYALGVMLYEALLNEDPFVASNPMEVLRKKQNEDAPQLRGRVGIPTDLASFTDGVLKREPAERLSSVDIVQLLQLQFQVRTRASSAAAGSRSAQESQGSQGSSPSPVEELGAELFAEDEVVLVGRSRQLAQLEDSRQTLLLNRKPAAVWVTGLSGEGKSTLVEHFLRRIRAGKEMLVLSGRCYDRESVPFKAIDSIIDSLVSHLRYQTDVELERILPPDIEMLARLFPLLRRVNAIDRRARQASVNDDERAVRNLAFASFKDLLVSISQKLPIVLSVEDLQWADADSALVLNNLLFSRLPPAVLLLGSIRRDEMDASPFLNVWHSQAATTGGTCIEIEVPVEPLTKEECLEFLETRFGPNGRQNQEILETLYRSTKGNPYFLEQIVESYKRQAGEQKPISLTQIIEDKLSHCPPDARDLLDLVSVIGKASLISAVTAVSANPSAALATMIHMRSERLVRLLGSRIEPQVDTYHDKIRESVLSHMVPERRRSLHLRIAEFIEQKYLQTKSSREYQEPGARVSDLAYHFTEAGDSRAFAYQLLAGESALEAFALETALHHFRQANSLRPANVNRSVDYQLQLGLGESLSRLGRLDESLHEYQGAVGSATTALERANCLFSMAEIHWRNSDYPNAWSGVRAALMELGERLPKSKIGRLLKACQSFVEFHLLPRWVYGRRLQRAPAILKLNSRIYSSLIVSIGQQDITTYLLGCTRGAAISKCLDGSPEKAIAYSSYIYLLSMCGVRWIARQIKSQLERDAEGDGDNFWVRGFVSAYYYSGGQLSTAIERMDRACLEIARSGNYVRWSGEHLLWHMWAIRGSSARQIHHAFNEQFVALVASDRVVLAYSKYGLAEGFAKGGDTIRAVQLANEAIADLKSVNSTFICVGQIQLAKVQIQMADYLGARESLKLALRDIPKLRFVELTMPTFPLYVESILSATWYQAPGKFGLIERLRVAWTLRLARLGAWLFPCYRSAAWRMRGRFAAAKGNSRRAFNCFGEAIAAAEKIGARYELARSMIDRSVLLGPDGVLERERGLALLEALGCVLPDAEVAYLGLDRAAHHTRAAANAAAQISEIENHANTPHSWGDR